MDQGTNLGQSVQPVVSQQQVPEDQQTQTEQKQQPQSPQTVSSSGKELAPVALEERNSQEIVVPTESEPILSPEVKEAGVTHVPSHEQIQVVPELQAVGVAPVKTAVSVQVAPSDKIQLPMTVIEAENTVKTHTTADSVRWFAALVLEHIKRMHQALKQNTNT